MSSERVVFATLLALGCGTAGAGRAYQVPRLDGLKATAAHRASVGIRGEVVAVEHFATLSESSLISLEGARYTILEVWRYRTREGSVFCYNVKVAPFVDDGTEGGVLALVRHFAIYDLDGDGQFEHLEDVAAIERLGEKPWTPRLPSSKN